MSQDPFRIDSHKLIYHPQRVSNWLEGQMVYPVYMELSPSGTCNQRCIFCGVDFMGYQTRFLDPDLLAERLKEMGQLGVKSIMYGGEGEPFLHKHMVRILRDTHGSGIDAAVTTNAVLMTRDKSEAVLDVVEWVKVSMNAGTPGTYSKIHGCNPAQFNLALKNLEDAANIIARNGYRCVLGAQILLLPENRNEVETLARLVRDIGLRYLVVKPYSQHPQSHTTLYQDVTYADAQNLAERLDELATSNFKPLVRLNTMKKWDEKARPYKTCLALPFWSYIDTGGNVWGCSVFLTDPRFAYGNIYDNTFEEIWTGQTRRKSLEWATNTFDPSDCRINCHMDEVNRYLWELKNPPAHVNFI
jgi:radical SAM protein with 4Fe4S-binding SPASM domain